jgi:uncharacterized protein with GYD domain
MAKYLIQANYIGDGMKGLLKEGGTSRRAAAEKAIKSVGGSLETFYYAFGGTDVYAIADLPDNVTAAALGMTISSSGRVSMKTTVLLSAEEMDLAAKKSPTYRAPGQ